MKFTSITRSLFLLAFMCIAMSASAQRNPVKWNGIAEKLSDDTYKMSVTGTIDAGWYVYSQKLESDMGPVPTSLELDGGEGLGDLEESGNRKEGMDKAFEMNVVKYLDNVTFSQEVRVPKGSSEVTYTVHFMTCNGELCLPPKSVDVTITL